MCLCQNQLAELMNKAVYDMKMISFLKRMLQMDQVCVTS